MSTSSDLASPVQALALPDLREGHWTRLGGSPVVGDQATEALLGGLAESTRRSARTQGYAVGWAEGRRAAGEAARADALAAAAQLAEDRQRQEQEHTEALSALRELAVELRSALDEACNAIDGQAAELALGLTRELVGATAAEAGEHALDRVRGLMPEHAIVTARLHPEVAAGAEALADAGIRVVADPSLGRADAVAETETGVLDLRVATALDRLREALS